MFAQSQTTCNECGGRGTIIHKQCPHCDGNKVLDHTQHYTLEVIAGMPEGHEVVFEGGRAMKILTGKLGTLYSECGAEGTKVAGEEKKAASIGGKPLALMRRVHALSLPLNVLTFV